MKDGIIFTIYFPITASLYINIYFAQIGDAASFSPRELHVAQHTIFDSFSSPAPRLVGRKEELRVYATSLRAHFSPPQGDFISTGGIRTLPRPPPLFFDIPSLVTSILF